MKTALIAGGALWERVRAIEKLDPEELDDVVFECARTKLAVVAADERDSGRRAVLNLGHTVGHAIEAASRLPPLPPRRGGRPRAARDAAALGRRSCFATSSRRSWRVTGCRGSFDRSIDTEAVLGAIERDKKKTSEGVGFVLLERAGEPLTGRLVEPDALRAAVEELRGVEP